MIAVGAQQSVCRLTLLLVGIYAAKQIPPVCAYQTSMQPDALPGLCHQESSMWEYMPSKFCKHLSCVWSPSTKRNIDLWLEILKPLDHHLLPSQCPAPEGGQTNKGLSTGVEIAFIITMHNNPDVAAQCLLELFRTAKEVKSAQFILIDDSSTEDVSAAVETGRQLKHLFKTNFLYIKNSETMGHAASCNIGAEATNAEYIAIVDSSVSGINGWLFTLMATVQSSGRIGMVGPLSITINATIADAGGQLFSDGSAESVQKGRPAQSLPSWLNRRNKVDYLGTAIIVLQRDVYLSLGGLSSVYKSSPWGYADLAMRVREANLDVVLQPLAVVYQGEAEVFGMDKDAHKAQLPVDDQDAFKARWREVLEAEYCPPQLGEAAANWRMRPSILYVEFIRPEPDRDAGSARAAALMRLLVDEGYSITYAATAIGFSYTQPLYEAQMRLLGVEIWELDLHAGEEWPLTHQVGSERRCRFDYILAARQPTVAQAMPIIKRACPEVPVIFDTVDVHYLRLARVAMVQQQQDGPAHSQAVDTRVEAVLHWLATDSSAGAEAARAVQHSELSLAEQADAVIAVSDIDLQILKRFRPDLNGHIISGFLHEGPLVSSSCLNRHGILFIGSFSHSPNSQAITHFLKEILPILRKELPPSHEADLQLHIVGSGQPPGDLQALMREHPRLIVTHVNLSKDLLNILLSRVKLFVAPLLTGGGVKGKVVMAMGHGVPVIAYPVAFEGIAISKHKDIIVARDAADYARKAAAAYTDCALWSELSQEGQRVVAKHFTDLTALEGLREVFKSLPRSGNGKAGQKCGT